MKLKNYEFLKPKMLIVDPSKNVLELYKKHYNNDWWVKETSYSDNAYRSKGKPFLLSFHEILNCKL